MLNRVKDLSERIVKCGVFTALGMLIVVSAYRQSRYENNKKKRGNDVWF